MKAKLKDVKSIRSRIGYLVDKYLEQDFEKLEPKERVTLLVALLKYILPQLKAVEHTGELEQKVTAILPEDLRAKIVKGLAE